MTHRHTTTDRLTITDIAIREGLGYYAARDRALKGQFGRWGVWRAGSM